MKSSRAFSIRVLIRGLIATCALALVGAGWAAEQFFGIFLQGERIGYMSSASSAVPGGTRSVLVTKIQAKLLGADTRMEILSDSLSDAKGRMLEMSFVMRSGGREQMVVAKVTGAKLSVARTSADSKEEKTLAIPGDGFLVDDPMIEALKNVNLTPGTRKKFLSFDPSALAIIENTLVYKGKEKLNHKGKSYDVIHFVIEDPRADSDLFLDSSGNMIVSRSLFGMEMMPITREEATGNPGYMPSVDLATATRVVPNKPIGNARGSKSVTLKMSGKVSTRLKSDAQQTVTRTGGVVTLSVHPVRGSAGSASTVAEVSKQQPQFLKQVDLIPSGDDKFVRLAASLVRGEKNAFLASKKIARAVYGMMKPNASIAVIRDASEILRTKEGVCRDYAILACTLMRAAGIPTKLVTGAVYAEGAFYYHAWVEAWTGKSWVPLDPTMDGGFDATHIKFCEGNPETALVIFTLDGVKIDVITVR